MHLVNLVSKSQDIARHVSAPLRSEEDHHCITLHNCYYFCMFNVTAFERVGSRQHLVGIV